MARKSKSHPQPKAIKLDKAAVPATQSEDSPSLITVTPVPTPDGTLFRFDRHPALSQVEWQEELFGHYSTFLLHIMAWGKPEYTAKNLGAANTEHFKAILSYGSSGMFNYVESLKSAILDAGLAERMKDEWLSTLPFSGFDIVHGLPAGRTALIVRLLGDMRPLCFKLQAEVRAEQGGKAAERSSETKDPPLFILGDKGSQPRIRGKDMLMLTEPQYDTLKALVDAAKEGKKLTKDKLDQQSGHTDSRKFLYQLVKSDPDWTKVIRLPGSRGRGYTVNLG